VGDWGGGYNVGDVKREKEGGTRGKRDRKGRKGGGKGNRGRSRGDDEKGRTYSVRHWDRGMGRERKEKGKLARNQKG
jgi:hypothetical protein